MLAPITHTRGGLQDEPEDLKLATRIVGVFQKLGLKGNNNDADMVSNKKSKELLKVRAARVDVWGVYDGGCRRRRAS